MHLYLDSAEWSDVAPLLDSGIVYGVTTNPTLQKAAGLGPAALRDFVRAVSERGARAVHVQVTHAKAREMIEDGLRYHRWTEGDAGRVVVKIPATREGLSAARELAQEGVACTLTAVYATEQALWAQLVGARYAAPYLGRLNDAGEDGLAAIAGMQSLLDTYPSTDLREPCRLLVASVRSRNDVLALLRIGVGAITVKPELVGDLVDHGATRAAEETFLRHAADLP